MRLIPYDKLKDALIDSRYTTMNHGDSDAIVRMPDRLKILGILGESFATSIYTACKNLKPEIVYATNMFPSEFIKAAHNFQLAVKQCHIFNKKITSGIFLELINWGIIKRQYITNVFSHKVNENEIPFFSLDSLQQKQSLLKLSTLLRACSEILYFDNHTTCGDVFYIDNEFNKIMIKSYNSLMSPYLYKNDIFPIKGINIFLKFKKIEIKFDMVGNYSTVEDINQSLLGYCIEIIDKKNDKKYVTIVEAEYLIPILITIIKTYSEKYRAIGSQQAIELITKCLFLVNKPLYDVLNIDYELTEDQLLTVQRNYDSNKFLSTADIFTRFSYQKAVEIIINPQKYI